MADIVQNFDLKFWNGFYDCTVRFPDGTVHHLKSADDLTYSQWQDRIRLAWLAHTTLPPTTLDVVRVAIIKAIQEGTSTFPIDKPKLIDSIVAAVEPWLRT